MGVFDKDSVDKQADKLNQAFTVNKKEVDNSKPKINKVTDNFSLDKEPLEKLKKYVLLRKIEGDKTSLSAEINALLIKRVKELKL